MINFDKDIERFDYASRGDEVRDSLIAMFEHVQDILHDDSVQMSPDELTNWLSSGIYKREIMYLDHVKPGSNAAVQSDALRRILGYPIKLIMQYGDEYERNNWVLNQMPGYPAVSPPTPQDVYNPITKVFDEKDGAVEFEKGWFAKGNGKIIYPYNREYITCEPSSIDSYFEVFYEVPIMLYPYLLQRKMTLVYNTTGTYKLNFSFTNEYGEEIPVNKKRRDFFAVGNPLKDSNFTDIFEPEISTYNQDWRLRIKFSGKGKITNEFLTYPRFYIERIRLMPYEVFKNG